MLPVVAEFDTISTIHSSTFGALLLNHEALKGGGADASALTLSVVAARTQWGWLVD